MQIEDRRTPFVCALQAQGRHREHGRRGAKECAAGHVGSIHYPLQLRVVGQQVERGVGGAERLGDVKRYSNSSADKLALSIFVA